MQLNKSKYFFNGTLPLSPISENVQTRGEKLILLHVRLLGYPLAYGGYSRIHSWKSNTRTL